MDALIERLQAVGMSATTAELVAGAARLADAVAMLEGRLHQERQAREDGRVEDPARIRAEQAATLKAEADEVAQGTARLASQAEGD